ncbi:Uncharacterized protein APZ42_010973 [Daphnia magna]|uniref:Uncharacterized protein n=1 Tax=Daphnia magna TaxID=35525 RepID=A0A162TBS6_9CRUS|nr:Uncharacterized protein APZ42_010973 [Daphnia magna]
MCFHTRIVLNVAPFPSDGTERTPGYAGSHGLVREEYTPPWPCYPSPYLHISRNS